MNDIEKRELINLFGSTNNNSMGDYFEVLSDENNITIAGRTPAFPYGVFDRRHIGKLRKPFIAILNHLAEI